jgi:ketosteroid isomerase-like protein
MRKNGRPAFIACLGAALLVGQPSVSASPEVDLAAAEAAVRKSDADWSVAAGAANVDGWMAFYAVDAIALLPGDRLASGRELLRRSVTRLLAQPHLSVAWHPIKVDVARSGDAAILTGAYELHFDDSRGPPGPDRGRRLEIWRRQADGFWKCTVDAWDSDESHAAPPATTAGIHGMSQAAGSEPLAQTAPPPLAPPPAPVSVAGAKYGDVPIDYEKAIRKYFLEHLKRPDSVQYREFAGPEQGYTTAVTGTFLMRETRQYGWVVKATINAKNAHDGYVGFKTYTFLFRGENIVDVRLPLPGDEMN